MKKFIVLFALLVVLEIPLELWKMTPEHEREMVRHLATIEHCEKEAKKGFTRFRIWEEIRDGKWQLHIQGCKTEV